MAEAKPVQPFADRTAMHRHAMDRGHFHGDLVQRRVALDCQPVAQPSAEAGQLALGMIALCLRHEATALALQDHHVVHEARRNPKVPRGLSMAMTFLTKAMTRLRSSTGCGLPIPTPYIWQGQRITNRSTW